MTRRLILPNFTPRPYQVPSMRYFDMGGKRGFKVWHRRGGKDLTDGHQTSKMAMEEVGEYWHIFPTGEQGRRALWEGFTADGKHKMEQIFPRAIRRRPTNWTPNAAMIVELANGSVWRILGSDRIEVVGAGPKGVVLSEYSLAKPKTWDLIRPMLRENNGWASINTTPRGKNHAWKQYEIARAERGWFCEVLTVRDTGLTYASNHDPDVRLTADEMMEEERRDGMPPELIRQEYLCDFTAALVGSYWGDLLEDLEKRGGMAPFEADTDGVFTAWDLGHGDSTAIWFFTLNELGGVDVIDWYEDAGKDLDHYFDQVEARGEDLDYRYVKHWLPHDAKNHHLGAKATILEQCIERWGIEGVAIGPEQGLDDGIQAVRKILRRETRFHPNCGEGIEALRQYHKKWDEDRKCFSNQPEHDWSSHSADAMRYLACAVEVSKQMLRPSRRPKPKRPLMVTAHGRLNVPLEQLWEKPRRGGGRI